MRLWKRLRVKKNDGWATAAAFSPDGRTVIFGNRSSIYLYDVVSGAALFTADTFTEGYERWWNCIISSVAFAPNGETFGAGSGDGKIHLWSFRSSERIHLIDAQSSVKSIAFSPDGKTLASASEDGAIRLWDVFTGTLALTMFALPEGNWLAQYPEGKFHHSEDASPYLRIGS
jgi:WD40 repeat protein